MKKLLNSFLLITLLASIAMTPFKVLAASTNLIANPSVETATNNQPSNWSTNSWGTNSATFSYATTGHTGSHAVSVSMTNYSSGDAKWQPDQVPVVAGQNYTYSDYSISNVTTDLDAAYMDATGKTSFVYLQSVPASPTWQQVTTNITVPAGIVSVSIYHIIYANGTLQTDDFSLTAQNSTVPTPPVTPPTPTPTPVPTPTPTPPPTPVTPTAPTNLITNGSFETANGSDPAGWQRGGWGTNTATLTYTTGDAHTGTRSATVAATSMTTGDVKWYASPVAVTAGTTYTYQDYYKSTTATPVVVDMTTASGVDSYVPLATAPSATAWTLYSASFTVPTAIASVTMYHLLNTVGSLTIDDTSLINGTPTVTPPTPTPVPTPTPGSNFIPNASFETANGTVPAGWSKDKWGTNTTAFSYVSNDAHSGTKSAKVTMSNYTTGDAKWGFTPITTLIPGSQYNFSVWYKTNTRINAVADYVDTHGVDQYLNLPNPLAGASAAATWQQYSGKLYVPTNAVSMTVFMTIASNGWVQTDDYSLTPYTPVGFSASLISLTFDDGWSSIYSQGLPVLKKYGLSSTQYIISGKINTTDYMTTAMVQAFKDSGSEIGAHTISHPDLTQLTTAQLATELGGSQTALRQLFGTDVAQDFATPYGLYNSATLTAIKQYYKSHRSTDVGFNSKDNFNPYDILVQNIETDTTPAQVAAWVAQAKANHTWLVLVYHAVSDSTSLDDYSVTQAHLDTELSNIKNSGIAVDTMSQALATLNSQL